MKTLYQLHEPLKGAMFVLFQIIKQNKRLTASNNKLAELTGYSPNTICFAIGALRNIGLITATRNHAREPYTYEVIR